MLRRFPFAVNVILSLSNVRNVARERRSRTPSPNFYVYARPLKHCFYIQLKLRA